MAREKKPVHKVVMTTSIPLHVFYKQKQRFILYRRRQIPLLCLCPPSIIFRRALHLERFLSVQNFVFLSSAKVIIAKKVFSVNNFL